MSRDGFITNKATALYISSLFLDSGLIAYGILKYLLTDKYLGMKILETTSYNPQTNGQTESYNKPILKRLINCVAKK